jgi:hypothetical protein
MPGDDVLADGLVSAVALSPDRQNDLHPHHPNVLLTPYKIAQALHCMLLLLTDATGETHCNPHPPRVQRASPFTEIQVIIGLKP